MWYVLYNINHIANFTVLHKTEIFIQIHLTVFGQCFIVLCFCNTPMPINLTLVRSIEGREIVGSSPSLSEVLAYFSAKFPFCLCFKIVILWVGDLIYIIWYVTESMFSGEYSFDLG